MFSPLNETKHDQLIRSHGKFLDSILHADDSDLCVFNSDFDNTQDILVKSQRLLNAYHEALKLTGGDLKLAKCF